MKTNFSLIALFLIFILFSNTGKVNAETRASYTDTICCSPDSLKVISVNYPVFCLSWKVPVDSNCITPYGFEVQWAPFPGSGPWTGKIKIYTGGSTVTFCDSVYTCRNYQWRVRTICDTTGDSTFSNWVYGPKFSMNCQQEIVTKFPDKIIVAPNPATNNVVISARIDNPGLVKLRIVNNNGKIVLEKNINVQKGELKKQLVIDNWQKGIYFISIVSDRDIFKGSFVKE